MRQKRNKKMLLAVGMLAATICVGSACNEKSGPDTQENVISTPGIGEEQGNQTEPEGLSGIQGVYSESPSLQVLTETGELPLVKKRLPVFEDMYVMSGLSAGVYGDDVQFAVENADELTSRLVSEGLFAYSDAGTITSNIAKHYTVNSDFTKYTIYLREGMRWSDGVPFTADDCVFFYEKMCLPEVFGESLWECFQVYDDQGKLQKTTFQKLDNYSFEVTFSQPKPEFLAQLLQQGGICFAPEHYYVNLLPEYMGADAATAKATAMGYASTEEMLQKTVAEAWNVPGIPTLNPYMISTEEGKNDVAGEYYEFVRNPYYWKTDMQGQQLPYLDRLGFTRISGESQKMLLTTEGFLTVSELKGEQVAEAKASATRGDYRVITWTGTLSYAVKNSLKNFPEKCPYEEVIRGIGAAHPEYWYVE